MRNGPLVTTIVKKSCEGCVHHTDEYYAIEDGNSFDSGFDHYCNHPTFEKRKDTGSSHGHTPNWCPVG